MKVKIALLLGVFLSPAFAQAEDPVLQGDWSGQYAGIVLGASYDHTNPSLGFRKTGAYFNGADFEQLGPEGAHNLEAANFNGGLLWGWNAQSGNIVYGFETDVLWAPHSEEHDSGNLGIITSPGNTFRIRSKIKSDFAASIRPRLGYAYGDSLFFGTAGIAVRRFAYQFDYSDNSAFTEGVFRKISRFTPGITGGFGVEQKLGDTLRLRMEYSFSYFDDIVDETSRMKNLEDGFTHEVDHQSHALRIALTKSF